MIRKTFCTLMIIILWWSLWLGLKIIAKFADASINLSNFDEQLAEFWKKLFILNGSFKSVWFLKDHKNSILLKFSELLVKIIISAEDLMSTMVWKLIVADLWLNMSHYFLDGLPPLVLKYYKSIYFF